jgi:hypothetical protein
MKLTQIILISMLITTASLTTPSALAEECQVSACVDVYTNCCYAQTARQSYSKEGSAEEDCTTTGKEDSGATEAEAKGNCQSYSEEEHANTSAASCADSIS